MQKNIRLESIIFLDIETVPQYENYEKLPDNLKKLWDKKAQYLKTENQTTPEIYERAGIYAEFGKIICISVGIIVDKNRQRWVREKSFASDDEKQLLLDFAEMIRGIEKKQPIVFCAHNGKEFDYPYIARRMLINGIKLPEVLNIAGKKPWEVLHLDTLHLWRFGDYKHYSSLNLLTTIFNIPTPKDDIDGSLVAEVYYKEKNIKRIVEYCQKDVLAVAQLFLRFRGEELIAPENVEIIENEKE